VTRRAATVAAAAMSLALATVPSCSGSPATPAAGHAEADASVWMVTGAPLATSPLEDRAAATLRRFPGIRAEILASSATQLPQDNVAAALAHRPDLLLVPPYEQDGYSVRALAEEHPRQRFGVISESPKNPPSNVAGYWIDVHESSYLAGLVAGSLTRTRQVGVVLGFVGPALNQFFYGFEQGVLAACAACRVTSADLAYDFAHPAHGKQVAEQLFRGGADVVFDVAGQSGLGVLQAASRPGRFAIGVDTDQDGLAPGHVIVSVLKRTDLTTAALVRSALDNTFDGGHVKRVGLAGGYSDLSWATGSRVFLDHGPTAMVERLPATVRAVDRARRDILAGRLVVCDALNAPDSAECAALDPPS
jgi:basic membrane protein A and related proteins